MNTVSADQDQLDMQFTQMGAKVQSIHGLLCFIRFDLNDTEFFYVYNINAKDQYYLQMVLPYPVGAGVFSSPEEIVKYVRNDIRKFKNAYNSKVFNKFIEVNTKLHHTIHNVEDVFKEYNVPLDKLEQIEDKLQDIEKLVDDIKSSSTKIDLK